MGVSKIDKIVYKYYHGFYVEKYNGLIASSISPDLLDKVLTRDYKIEISYTYKNANRFDKKVSYPIDKDEFRWDIIRNYIDNIQLNLDERGIACISIDNTGGEFVIDLYNRSYTAYLFCKDEQITEKLEELSNEEITKCMHKTLGIIAATDNRRNDLYIKHNGIVMGYSPCTLDKYLSNMGG